MALADKYITITQASEKLGVTRQTVSRWIHSGYLKGEKLGRQVFINIEDLQSVKMKMLLDLRDIEIKGDGFCDTWADSPSRINLETAILKNAGNIIEVIIKRVG